MPTEGDWSRYANQVLAELKRHDEWLEKLDKNLNNHITDIEHRLTKIESYQRSQKWMLGILFSMVIGIFSMLFATLVL